MADSTVLSPALPPPVCTDYFLASGLQELSATKKVPAPSFSFSRREVFILFVTRTLPLISMGMTVGDSKAPVLMSSSVSVKPVPVDMVIAERTVWNIDCQCVLQHSKDSFVSARSLSYLHSFFLMHNC